MLSLTGELRRPTMGRNTIDKLTNYKNQAAIKGAYTNSDGLSVYNSLLQALRDSAAMALFPYAYSADGGTIYGMDNRGNTVPFSFSRAGNATVVDKDGKMKYAVKQNQLTYSEDLTQAIYSKGAVTCDVNKIKEDNTNNSHYIVFNTTTPTVGAGYGLSADFMAAERTSIKFGLNMSGIGGVTATIDLSAGTITNLVNVGAGFNNYTASIQLINGWYRVTIKVVALLTNSIYGDVYLLDSSGNSSYAGIPGKGVYMNRVQWKTEPSYDDYVKTTGTAVTTYVPRFYYDAATLLLRGLRLEQAGTNLNPYSQIVRGATGSGWVLNGNVTVTDDNIYSILSAYYMAKVTQVDNTGYIYTNNITVSASTIYTASVFVKAGTAGRYFNLSLQNTDSVRVWFDLQTGTVLSNQVNNTGTGLSFISAAIENYGNSIYRVSLTINSGTNTAFKVVLSSTIADATNTRSTGTVYVDHVQLEVNAVSSFIPTLGSTVTRAAETLQSNSDLVNYPAASVFIYGTFDKNDYSTQSGYFVRKGTWYTMYATPGTPTKAVTYDQTNSVYFGNNSLPASDGKFIASYGSSGLRATTNGAAVTSGAYVGSLTSSNMLINPTNIAKFYIKAIIVIPRQVTDAEMQAFTQ